MIVERLKGLVIARLDINDMIEAVAETRTLLRTYEEYGVRAPGFLKELQHQLDLEIGRYKRDALAKREGELLAQLSGMRSPEERKRDIETELAQVRADLGGTSA